MSLFSFLLTVLRVGGNVSSTFISSSGKVYGWTEFELHNNAGMVVFNNWHPSPSRTLLCIDPRQSLKELLLKGAHKSTCSSYIIIWWSKSQFYRELHCFICCVETKNVNSLCSHLDEVYRHLSKNLLRSLSIIAETGSLGKWHILHDGSKTLLIVVNMQATSWRWDSD